MAINNPTTILPARKMVLHKFPLAIHDRSDESTKFPCIKMAQQKGAYDAVKHLIKPGHEKIAYRGLFMRLFFLLFFLCTFLIPAYSAEIFYVSTGGNDSFSGVLPEVNRQSTDGPLATLQGARNKIRELKTLWGGDMKDTVEVQIRGGLYYDNSTLELLPQDSGTKQFPIIYKAYKDEKPIISGGSRISGLEKQKDGSYCAVVEKAKNNQWNFRQLWIGDKRYTLAQSPNKGYYYVKGIPPKPENLNDPYWNVSWPCHNFIYDNDNIKDWPTIKNKEITLEVFSLWEVQTVVLESVDTQNNTARVENHVLWGLTPHKTITAGGQAKRYIVQNAPDALDYPGEWYLNRNTGKVTVIPFDNEDLSRLTAIAPVTETAIEAKGKPAEGKFVEHIIFEGISFMHYKSPSLGSGRGGGYRSAQGAANHPACMRFDGTNYFTFEECTIAHNGTYAIEFSLGCKYNTVRKCHIYDVGAGGIVVGVRKTTQEKFAPGENELTSFNTIENNYIHHTGQVVKSGMGILLAQSDNNKIINNEISYSYQTGIQIGWNWDESKSYSHDNYIGFNYVHNIGLGQTSDLGGIYTVGENLRTTVTNNVIHDVFSWMEAHAVGIYPDENTKGVTFENNIVYNTGSRSLGVNYCREITVHNNIFSYSCDKALFSFGNGALATITNNIFYYNFGNPYADHWNKINKDWFVQCDRNLFWKLGGANVVFQDLADTKGIPVTARLTFEEWKSKTGFDTHSIIADPMFKDPENGDFSFSANSPYTKIGFKPIDARMIGLKGDEQWKRLPQKYTDKIDYPSFSEEFSHPELPPRETLLSLAGFRDDFESSVPFNKPKTAEIQSGKVFVTNEKSKSGDWSAKAVYDGGCAAFTYSPYDYIVNSGRFKFVCDFYAENNSEIKVTFTAEKHTVELQLSNEKIVLDHKDLGFASLNCRWFTVEIKFDKDKYDFRMVDENGRNVFATKGKLSHNFQYLKSLSFSSSSQEAFYIDNLSVE